jgi:amidase
MHVDGLAIWTPIALEGLQAQMMHGNGMGFNWEGLYTTSLLDAHANWRARANQLSRTLKISMIAGEYFIRQYRGHYYAKAQNLVALLRKTYNERLTRHDLLLMPTTPMKATPIPPQDAPLALYCQRAFEMLPNTAPFDVSGHPAMNVPCGMSAGLPVGMQLSPRTTTSRRSTAPRTRSSSSATGATSERARSAREQQHGRPTRSAPTGSTAAAPTS